MTEEKPARAVRHTLFRLQGNDDPGDGRLLARVVQMLDVNADIRGKSKQ